MRVSAPSALLSTPLLAASLVIAGCGESSPAEADTDRETTGLEFPGSSGTDPSGSGTADSEDAESSGGSSTGAPEPVCGDASFTLMHQPANVMLVLDKSRSMVDEANLWDHDNDETTEVVTRWNSLHASVSFLVDEFDQGINFGALLFPAASVEGMGWQTACDVEAAPDADVASENGGAILEALPEADDVNLFGGTPTRVGIETSIEYLLELDDDVPRALILITDGAANCQDGETESAVYNVYDEALPDVVRAALEDEGIPTYVIGIDIRDEIAAFPMDNPFERLNEVAIAGGFPRPGEEKFYNAQDEEELRLAMSQVSTQIGCTIPLDEEPSNPTLLTVEVDGEVVEQVESCDDTDVGWQYTNPDGPYDEIELCSTTCTDMHDVGNLLVNYVCQTPG